MHSAAPGIRSIVLTIFIPFTFILSVKNNEVLALSFDLPQLNDSVTAVLTEGTNMAIDLSPDKKTVAADIQGTIWAIPITGGTAVPLTDYMGDSHQPSWSPDGNKVAFFSFRDGYYHIWCVQKDGSKLEQLTFGVYDEREPDWSPDGKSIVFSSDRSGNYDLWKMDIASKAMTQLTHDVGNDYFPNYSPDGKSIAFVSERTTGPGIYLLSAEGTERLVARNKGRLSAPSWNVDGTAVYFNSFTGSASTLELSVMDGKESKTVSEKDEDVFPFKISWAAPDEYLYTGDGKIKRKKVNSKKSSSIPFKASVTVIKPKYERKKYAFDNTPTAHPVKGIKSLNISPDGKKLLFSAMGNIWLLEKGNSKPIALTNDIFMDSDPCWSPDGNKILFVSDRAGSMNFYLHDVQSNTQELLLKSPVDLSYPSWSPDGKQIAYYEADTKNTWGRGTLNVIDVATCDSKKIHESVFVPGQMSWSHDGKVIALSALEVNSTRFREGINKILLVSLDHQPDRYVSPVKDRSLAMRTKNGPAWSPDGTMMAYVQDGLLWTIAVDPSGTPIGAPRRLTNELSEGPSWTKNSKYLAYLATDTIKIVNVIDGEIETIPLDFTWQYKQPEETSVIHAGKLFDGRNNKYQTNVDVVITGNRIKEIVPHQAGRTGKVIDASNKTLIPGLFEMHTHLHAMSGEKLGRLWLSFGITSIRETGADPYDALERKEGWDTGSLIGPREFFTGGLTDGTRIYYGLANSIQSTAHLDLELERASRLGYDMIKTYVRMPDILQEKITRYAHKIGVPVSSHEIFPATHYGVDAVEHVSGTSRRGYSPKLTSMNKTYQDVFEIIIKSQMNITPTAALQGGFYVMADKTPGFYDNRQFKTFYSDAFIKETQSTVPMIEKLYPGYISNFPSIQQTIKKLIASGARVTPGTDSPFVPYAVSLHTELQCWVDGGITPFEALRSATLWSAEAVGVSKDLGTIEVGKLADMVIVDGDPLLNIKDAWNVDRVIKNGIGYEIEKLLQRQEE